MKSLLLALSLTACCSVVRSAELETVSYVDNAAVAEAWKGQGESQAPVLFMGGDLKRAVRFYAPFASLKDWRVYWDKNVKADLSQEEQILVTVRAAEPGAVSQGILFFRSGPGWYRLPSFSVGQDWTTVILSKEQAALEGEPSGWAHIDGMRLSFLPGEKRDTVIELAGLATRSGWPLEHLGAVGGYESLSQSAQAFRLAAKGLPQEADVETRLVKAEGLAKKAASTKDSQQRQAFILEGREQVSQAFALIQSPKDKEFRCLWVHHGDGPRALGGDRVQRWKDALPMMKAQGYNAVAPNVLWSGVAFYPSKIVPVFPGVATEGDYLQEILDAAKPLGMKVHAWKVMWQFSEGWQAPAGVSEPFRKQGRLQMDAQGKELPWLCPCDERNRSYELAAIKELARNYAIDGIHLDYIRWDGDKGSFTPMCRKRFEAWSHAPVAQWPGDVLAGGTRQAQWQDFKRDVITSFVRETRQALKKIKPKLQLSAAVFPDAGLARNAVFQDWPLWVKEGLVDWVATMTYNEDPAGFKASVKQQQALMVPGVKLYPGMQFTYDAGRTLALDAAVEEIKAVRDLGLEGFAVFEWRDQLQDSIGPYLKAGLLREGPYALVQRVQPAYARPAEPLKGQALDLKPGKDGSVLLDDFEDGNLANEANGSWGLDFDTNKLGTTAGPQPLQVKVGGAQGSRYSLGFKGHFGKNQAPWPYALLYTFLNADHAPTDLSPFSGMAFFAKGDGRTYEVVLHQPVVKDFGYYRATFRAGSDWAPVALDWKDFKQPGWAKPVQHAFVDVDQAEFAPSGLTDEDFDLSIDTVRFKP